MFFCPPVRKTRWFQWRRYAAPSRRQRDSQLAPSAQLLTDPYAGESQTETLWELHQASSSESEPKQQLIASEQNRRTGPPRLGGRPTSCSTPEEEESMDSRDTAPDSWEQEEYAEAPAPSAELPAAFAALNVNAKPFVPNVNAPVFVPSFLQGSSAGIPAADGG